MTQRAPLVRLYADEVVIDMFAGGGGTSTGVEMILGRPPDVAVNHNREALAMHMANHPTTRHLCEDVRDVKPDDALRGKRCGLLWLSPDCTYHSKARGGRPFRDRQKARRVRGLIGIALKWAKLPNTKRPRIIFVENVEEIEFWCPLGADGLPDPERRGENFRKWVQTLKNRGYAVEWRQLRASDFGAPTSRKRLFIIARCDGQPIAWPMQTHGKYQRPVHTAAECIDFDLPVPSIFLTPKEAKAWGKAHGVPAPRRPLATATMRRIARGIQRFVINSPAPFIVKFHGERRDGEARGQTIDEPLRTLDTSNRFALVAPTLIQTSYGERKGQAPRTLDLFEPLGTIVAGGIKHSLVAAFLAKHNGGHEATGQPLETPMDTVVCRENKALVTSHLLKLYGTCQDGASVDAPMPTVTAYGNHVAEVRAFLMKFYGTKKDGCLLDRPLDTVTTKGRFGLVTVTIGGEQYAIVDIGMRMLSPRELFRAQGFPNEYQIEHGIDILTQLPVRFTKQTQTRLVGNSVPPDLAAAVIGANLEAVA